MKNNEPENKELERAIQQFKQTELNGKTRKIAIDKDIKEAVKLAYRDMQARTIKGHTPQVRDACCEWLTNELIKMREKEKVAVRELQEKFLKILNDKLSLRSSSQEFGKAQKVVNMSIKYLFCYEDKDQYSQLFSNAEMPLDQYTLKWYCSFSNETYSSWSNLSQKQYEHIARKIKDYLEECPAFGSTTLPKEPLRADFIVWSEEKVKAKIKSLKADIRSAANDGLLRERLTTEDKNEIEIDCKKLMSRE